MEPEQIHRAFAESEYGKTLEQNVRFGDFKPDYIPNDLWEMILGDDINNLRHMPYTYEIAKRFARYEKLGGRLLNLAAMTHDWGEAVVGDVALPDKQAAGIDLNEIAAYNRIATEVVPDEDLSLVPLVVWGDHELAEPFRAVEYIGYYSTSIRAGNMAEAIAYGVLRLDLPRRQRDGLVGGLLALNKAVSINNYPTLTRYAELYPSIPKILLDRV